MLKSMSYQGHLQLFKIAQQFSLAKPINLFVSVSLARENLRECKIFFSTKFQPKQVYSLGNGDNENKEDNQIYGDVLHSWQGSNKANKGTTTKVFNNCQIESIEDCYVLYSLYTIKSKELTYVTNQKLFLHKDSKLSSLRLKADLLKKY